MEIVIDTSTLHKKKCLPSPVFLQIKRSALNLLGTKPEQGASRMHLPPELLDAGDAKLALMKPCCTAVTSHSRGCTLSLC